MEKNGGDKLSSSSSSSPAPKFAVYQNPALSTALTSTSIRPPLSTFLCIISLSTASLFALLSFFLSENGVIATLRLTYISPQIAYLFAKSIEIVIALFLLATLLALIKAISVRRLMNTGTLMLSPHKGVKEQTRLTNKQLELLGIRPKVEQTLSDSKKKPPKSKVSSSPSNPLVPIHQPIITLKPNTSSGSKIRSLTTQSRSPASPSLYHAPAPTLHSPSTKTSPGGPGPDQLVSTPWSSKRSSLNKEITTEEEFERFLADIDNKISESASKFATPPPTVSGFGIASPNTIASSANTSGTTRSTPLRPVKMSPSSQKFKTPPKKGEGELPPPMSMEEYIEAFVSMGIYPQIEQWRDRLRQWFSLVLLNPLLNKIENCHTMVMEAAAKLGISIKISHVGSDLPNNGGDANASQMERISEWRPASTLDEENLLHQLRATLVQALDASMSRLPSGQFQQSPQQTALIPALQGCIDTITEHQRLRSLVKGEWVKGLLPQSSVRADYTVQRIRELAEGTCVKNYEYMGSGEVYDNVHKKWTLELPTDSHLLLYLFCAYIEHPKWMLHTDPTSYAGALSSKNPLFLGALPPKERFPENYIAAISGVPSVLHPGATILAVGKQSSPLFVLYWDKKPHFSLQGRTALWDSILVVCHRIKTSYGGIVKGVHLGSSALAILPVLESETED